MGYFSARALLSAAAVVLSCELVSGGVTNNYATFKNVRTGASGGFVDGIVFNPNHKGLAFARTDIGGAYKYNSWDDSWTPLQDGTTVDTANDWGVDGIATDPTEVSRVYLLTGLYTNGWDGNNGSVLRSLDFGQSFQRSRLPFKVGGNMYGRGMGERIAVDPNQGSTLLLGARSGNGLWKSTNYGETWAKVSSFVEVGNWPTPTPNPDIYGNPNIDFVGISWIAFDAKSGRPGAPTPRIFVAVANNPGNTIFVTNDAGKTWAPVAGQPTEGFFAHKGKLSPKENVLYISYGSGPGPNEGGDGSVWKYNLTDTTWTDISPQRGGGFGYGGLSIDIQKPGVLMVAALNMWWPDTQIWRSLDSGKTWKAAWQLVWPKVNTAFTYDISTAPWLQDFNDGTEFRKVVGHWIESLEIDPFDSNHFLYGTGATVQGSKNLLDWDIKGNFTLKSLSVGIEETAVQDLQTPLSGAPLISAVGDIGGFVHNDVNIAPAKNHRWGTLMLVDYAGAAAGTFIRGAEIMDITYNGGVNWTNIQGAPSGAWGGSVALTADGKTVLWRTSNGQVVRSVNGAAFVASGNGLPTDASIVADRKNSSRIYAVSGASVYFSESSGANFTFGSKFSSTATYNNDIAVNPFTTGEVWITSGEGAYHSVFPFTSWNKASDIVQAHQISVGKPKTTGGVAPVYLFGFDATWRAGLYRSDDEGKNWVKMNDNAKNGFSDIRYDPLAADTQRWGRVYTGTNGRGMSYGDAK